MCLVEWAIQLAAETMAPGSPFEHVRHLGLALQVLKSRIWLLSLC